MKHLSHGCDAIQKGNVNNERGVVNPYMDLGKQN